MKEKTKAAIFWSGGKDAAFALEKTRDQFDVSYLVTTLSRISGRVAMHGIREELLERQAEQIGIPLLKMWTSEATNEAYERALSDMFLRLKAEGIHHIIFGDIFLDDLKAYRDKILDEHGLTGIYPLWKSDTQILLNEMLAGGLRAVICCASGRYFNSEIPGIELRDLKQDGRFDPCGENGEYHTFCFDGKIFRQPVSFRTGETIKRTLGQGELATDFYFIEIL